MLHLLSISNSEKNFELVWESHPKDGLGNKFPDSKTKSIVLIYLIMRLIL